MAQVRVESFTISLDGYGAGPKQDVDNGLGAGDGTTGIDDDFAARGFRNIGTWILGRNMFGPIRGPWPDLLFLAVGPRFSASVSPTED